MTNETADKPRPRGINTHTTVADIAAHKDAIAVFAYVVGSYGSHTLAERHGFADEWRVVAESIATAAEHAGGDSLRLNIGDAQTVWYVRDGSFAVVVALAKGSTLGKSVLRMCRRAMKTMAATAKADRMGEAATAQAKHDTATLRAREATGW